ncbi:hypothetical protein DVA67_006035 [Solirubrobacter sp. CPCC 204708]|uniref:Uncharacterized protein n=1 Tax=Solirubrobacter deserti TaxID=2282478 RepID=A0ABT4RCT6_9ACTN|nr:hypothetical protein [Solirubrobacter deserti]MBE2315526.1 hypothetical protein [Solirubrobacter deserti]MDA0136165.1 hypothetical protein [Solirubrobacter deserti]
MLTIVILGLALFGAPGWLTHTTAEELSFSYQAIGEEDEFDQVLTIKNDGLGAVAPKLKITPLDSTSQPISGLKVTSAFGSTNGTMIIPSFFEDFDILKFEGARADEVYDVRVEVVELKQVDYPDMPEGGVVIEQYLNEGKPSKEFDDPFDALELHNPNDDDLTIKIALIAWQEKEGDAPQQFDWVITSGPAVTVPANSRKTLRLGQDTAGIRYVTAWPFQSTTS